MVFSSPPPLYLDPPNWQQHPINQQQLLQAHHHEQIQHHLIPQNQVPQPQPNQHGIGGNIGAGTQQNRAHSMSERARLAKIPPPEVPLKCPRCDSNNTKFCYYNNYSLSQPRHFCKTCRRYWTRGGALRNVPVGGGCRRNNKRASSKSNSGGGGTSSKSTLSTSQSTMVCDPSSGINVNSLCGVGNSGMSFMASLQNIAQLGGMSTSNMGLPYGNGSMNTHNSNTTPLEVATGANASGSASAGYNNLGFPQHQIQFPNFLGGFDMPSSSENGGLYSTSFQNVHQGIIGDEDHEQQDMNDNTIMSKTSGTSRSIMSPVKMEDNGQQGLKLAKQLLMGISSSSDNNNNNNNNNNNLSGNNCNQFWGGNMTNSANVATSMWTDLSRLNSSSTSHLL